MKNPLIKRVPREFRHDLPKYLVIFVFMVLLIGLVSGFLAVDKSFEGTYLSDFRENKTEDGHFAVNRELPEDVIDELEEKSGVSIYPYFYFEKELNGEGKNVRVYSTEREVNLINLMYGEMPEKSDEIILDRMFADNNEIKVGDKIRLGRTELTVSGLGAFPDYSALFENNSDMMFDAVNFCVGAMTDEGIEAIGPKIVYNYAWLFPQFVERTDKETAKNLTDDFVDIAEDVLTEYDENIADKAIASGKLIMLDSTLSEIDKSLKAQGMDISAFDNEEGYKALLEQINTALDSEGIDLSEELAEGEKEVTLTEADVKLAMKASQADIDRAQEYIDNVENEIIDIKDFLPRYVNQAINFTGDDMGSDSTSFIIFDYILTAVLAFVFAIIIGNTIVAESGVIGTLRASGYTKGELIRHYMILPVIVSIISAIIGNVLGYTVFSDYFIDIYYRSFCFPLYEGQFNTYAFVLTTVVPIVIMAVINLLTLTFKLKLSPLRFLRHDLGRKGKKKSFRLNTKIPFLHRFRLRIIFQNIPNYIIMFFGIFIGGVIVVFSLMYTPLLEDYRELILDDRICDYQYVLEEWEETDNDQAEAYSLNSLKTMKEGYVEDEVSIFGLVPDSKYVSADIADGRVIFSNTITEKYSLKVGDEFTMKDPFNSKKTYTFEVGGIYGYNSGLAIFMTQNDFAKMFDKKSDEFTGYFSNEELSDLDENNVETVITVDDLTKVSDQMTRSMGDMVGVFVYAGVMIFIMLMYIMSKQIIERNLSPISMSKILGFGNGEISGLYVMATTIIVVLSLLLTIPLTDIALRYVFKYMMYVEMSGYIPYIVSKSCYVEMFVIGLVSYGVVVALQMWKISRIPKADALKNAE